MNNEFVETKGIHSRAISLIQMLWNEDTPRLYRIFVLFLLVIGALTLLFDVMKKTIFLNASWNYNYPYWNFVYDAKFALLLVGLAVTIVILYPRLLNLSSRKFTGVLFGLTLVTFLVSLFSLPLEAIVAFDVRQRGLYDAAVFLNRHGPLTLLSSYHSLPGSIPEHSEYMLYEMNSTTGKQELADKISTIVAGANFIPFNDYIAADIDTILVQKHGPASLFLVAPFLLLFGTRVEVATLGSFVLASLIPVIAYLTYRLYFAEQEARTGALLVAFAPALFFFTRQAAPVPYDVFTGLYLAAGVYLLLRGVARDEHFALAFAGVALSLAAMTKITGLFILPTLLLLTGYWIRRSISWSEFAPLYTALVGVPIVLLAAGYNFVAQYVFTVLKIFIDVGGEGTRPEANDNLNNAVIAHLAPAYNSRWMGVPLLIFVLVFLVWFIRERATTEEKDIVAILLLLSISPFVAYLVFNTGTLSRHMIPFIVPIGFAGVRGFELLIDEGIDMIVLGRLALIITLAAYIINI